MRKFKRILFIVVSVLIFLISISLFTGSIVMYFSKNREAAQLHLEKVSINGTKQWISLSELPSQNKKPVLLFLHGGPGSANISLLNVCCPQLNEYAVIINWDQRGAGKSFSLFDSKKSLSVEQNIADAHVLTQYLKQKYDVDKISLMGFSAGTVLGLCLIDRYPQDYNLYISVSQMVDGKRGEVLSLAYTLNEARKNGDIKAVANLENICFDFSKPETILSQTQKQRTYLLKYGGVYHSYTSYNHEMKSLWESSEYSFLDFLLWPLGSQKSLDAMWHEVVLMDMMQLVTSVDVPVVFFCGKYDMNNPISLTEEYMAVLDARQGKELIYFNNSAHGIFWDEPDAFAYQTIDALEKYAKNP